MTLYGLYGLGLESTLDFPELPEHPKPGSAPDVRLSRATLRSPKPAGDTRRNWFGVRDDEAWFDWQEVGRVRIQGGRTIEFDPVEGVDPAGLRTALLGPTFTVLLSQRGLYPLHGSAVAIDGHCIALVAHSGMGKSTLALALSRAGHTLLADDVCALEVDADPILLRPGFPQQKLEPALLEALGESWESLPVVHPGAEKRARRQPGAFRFESRPIDRVFLIEDGPLAIEGPLSTREAFLAARAFGHRAQLLEKAVVPGTLMQRCATLAESVPFHRLSRPRDLERLGELCRFIEHNLRS